MQGVKPRDVKRNTPVEPQKVTAETKTEPKEVAFHLPPQRVASGGKLAPLRMADARPAPPFEPVKFTAGDSANWMMKAVAPWFGNDADKCCVHVHGHGMTVDMEAGPGLAELNARANFCDFVVGEIIRAPAVQALSPQDRYKLHAQAVIYGHTLACLRIAKGEAHLTVKNLPALVNEIGKCKKDIESGGAPLEAVTRSLGRLEADLDEMELDINSDEPLGWIEAFGQLAASSVTRILLCAICKEGMAAAEYLPEATFGGRAHLRQTVARLACVEPVSDADQVAMIRALRSDSSLAEPMLEYAAWLSDTFRGAVPDGAITVDTMLTGLILCLPAEKLDELNLRLDDVDWLARQALLFLGYAHKFLKSANVFEAGMDRLHVLADSAREFIDLEFGPANTFTQRMLAPIAQLRRNAERMEKLARAEADLRQAFPGQGISFEGEDIEELCKWFIPPNAGLPAPAATLALPAPDMPQAVAALAVAVDKVQAEPPAQTAHPAAATHQGEEAYSLDKLKAQWKAFKRARAKKLHASAAVPPTAAQPASQAAKLRPGKQPGSKPRLAGYEHNHPANSRALPKAEAKGRMARLLARTGKYTSSQARREVKEVD